MKTRAARRVEKLLRARGGPVDSDEIDDEGTIHESIYRHEGIERWHHHHTDAGVVFHDTEATKTFVDHDEKMFGIGPGQLGVSSGHSADHDTLDLAEVCIDLCWAHELGGAS